MFSSLAAVLLGLVQGLTEFLPVSSSGHLIITSALLDLTDERIKTFEVVIQLGSILAVMVLYCPRFMALLDFRGTKAFSGFRGLYLLFLTCLPASAAGLLLHDYIKAYLFTPQSVAAALAVGACFIFYAEWRSGARHAAPAVLSVDDISPKQAFGIGCFQCLSLWPGFSRSTSTIMGGMLLGADRKAAAEYSFLAAVPIMIAASGLSLWKDRALLGSEDLSFFLLGTAVSFLASLAAIKGLLRLISSISFRPFAWYRLCIAPLVIWFWA